MFLKTYIDKKKLKEKMISKTHSCKNIDENTFLKFKLSESKIMN